MACFVRPTLLDEAHKGRVVQLIQPHLIARGMHPKDPAFLRAATRCITLVNDPAMRRFNNGYQINKRELKAELLARSAGAPPKPLPQPLEQALAQIIDFADPIMLQLLPLCIDIADELAARHWKAKCAAGSAQ